MDTTTAPKNATNIVLLRGLIRSIFHWMDFPQSLQQALPDYQILTPELAGNGERFKEQTPFSIQGMMEDIRQQVIHAQGVDQPVILVAVSMGAMIASEWAKQYPEEVAQLHLINTSFSNLSPPWHRMRPSAFFPLASKVHHYKKLEQVIISKIINLNATPELEESWKQFSIKHPLAPRNGLAQLLAASRYRGPRQAPVDRVYLYCCREDRLVNCTCTQRIAEKWQKPLLIHDSAGHDLPLDDPGWLIEKLSQNIR